MLAVVVAMALAVGGCGPPIWCNRTVLQAQPNRGPREIHTHLTIERLTREARITGAVQDTWYGVYRRPHETRGFIDCAAGDEAPMPAELVGIDGR